ncbi:MAG TPA: H(+)/Cl(-) exchange transporter ClcA [Tepidisphaeraceae bacterium]|jgi:CIC family chloride channel protein|nr:H(+)/Cl(-) exchange transporter ClcA [Tepidisphaeraceae bacterium]
MSTGSPSIATVPTAKPLEPMPGITADDDRLPQKPMQWLALMVVAAFVGAGAGLVGGVFRLALVWLDDSRTNMVQMVYAHVPHWIGWLIPTALCAAGAYISVWLTQTLSPQTAGSGIPRVEAALRTHLAPVGAVILPVKFIGGVLSIGSGLALGREGPTVQMGGTIGRIVGDWLRRIIPEPWTLIAAGAGAGLAVAFNAPLAAALFVMEELLHRFSARVFSATLIACITGTVVLRAVVSNATDFSVASFGNVPAGVLPNYLLMGIVAGFLGVAFNVTLLAALRLFDCADRWPRGIKGAVVGAAAGLLAWYAPRDVGGGESLAQFALSTHVAIQLMVMLLLIRFALTMTSYGCGAPGGIFAPLLALGALLGNAYASATAYVTHVPTAPAAYAIVAMAACFTSIVRSPLTGVVLLLEMTGGWTLILPMMAASLTAYAVPELLGNPPIYDSLRERDELKEKELRSRKGKS